MNNFFKKNKCKINVYNTNQTLKDLKCINVSKFKKILIIAIKYNDYVSEIKFNKNYNFSISVSFLNHEEMKKLNKTYRLINKTTDVLSFSNATLVKKEYDLGDVFINWELLLQTKKANLEDDINFLFTHAVLHLLGYNHKDLVEEKIMFTKQEFILEKLN